MASATTSEKNGIPSTLSQPGAIPFWIAVIFIGAGTGLGAAALTRLLETVQKLLWGGDGVNILDAAKNVPLLSHILILLAAGVVTGIGHLILKKLTSGNGIDITTAIWFKAGRMPSIRTTGSAVLSVILVGMGVSLGREGAPKQVGAVIANSFCDKLKFSDEERRLLVACGAGAGMAAAYGVPLGGALFSLEVLRGMLALRLVLPAILTSLVATGVSWLILPNVPTYTIPSFSMNSSIIVFALVMAPLAGLLSVGYVRAIAWADRSKPKGLKSWLAPIFVLAILGLLSIPYPQLLGNGRDVSQLAFLGKVAPLILLALLFLKPLATIFCTASGVPGGLFTPSLTFGALLGALLGHGWNLFWPGTPFGLYSLLGAGAILAATTQGPISAIVLMMELTGRDRSFILPLSLSIVVATLISRSIEPRSIYEARLSDQEVEQRLQNRMQLAK